MDKTPVEDLHFADVAGNTYMDINRSVEGAEWPLEISMVGQERHYIQTYNMNENELFALFNLLTDILTDTYEKRIQELRFRAGIYNSLQEDE